MKMDRLWSNVSRPQKSDASKPHAAEIVMDPREADFKGSSAGLTLGNLVPDFSADSTAGKIDFHRWIGDKWALLLGHPFDFHPIAATELAHLAKIRNEFRDRDVRVAVVSRNSVEDHLEFVHDIESTELPAGAPIDFPLISDPDLRISESFGMLDSNVKPTSGLPLTCRSIFLVGPDKRLKFSMLYPAKTGRNLSELLRVIDSIKLTTEHQVLTPVNWAPGDPCAVLPTMVDASARDQYGRVTTVATRSGRNYIRFVGDPSGGRRKSFSWGRFFSSLLGIGTGIVIGAVGGKVVQPIKQKLNQ